MAPSSVRDINVVYDSDTLAAATANSSTIAELVSTIPHTWRSSLGEHLTSTYRIASKLCTVQNTIAQYERHTADGSFPPAIRNAIRDPKVQFSKEFLGTENGNLAGGTLSEVIHTARKNLLSSALDRKQEEMAALQHLVAFDESVWRRKVMDVAIRAGQTFNVEVEAPPGGAVPTWTGNTVPSDVKRDCSSLWIKGSTFHYRAVSLARALADRTLVEKTKTLSLKRNTDVTMRDADAEHSTRDVVRDEMKAQMAALELRLVKSLGPARKSAPPRKKKGGSNSPPVKQRSPIRKGNNKGRRR